MTMMMITESVHISTSYPVQMMNQLFLFWTFTSSPEWDTYGTHLERPLPHHQPLPRVTRMDRPTNLSLVLPLTSTPVPVHKSRVSGQRRLLPLEAEDQAKSGSSKADTPTQKFLEKLNPFRKRGR